MGNTATTVALLGAPDAIVFAATRNPRSTAGNAATAVTMRSATAPGRTPQSATVPARTTQPATAPGRTLRSATVAGRTPQPAVPAPAAALGGSPPAVAEPPRSRRPATPAPGAPAAPARRAGPHRDPKFVALKADVAAKARTVGTSHPPARDEATNAQDAALPPRDDEQAQGKAANAEKMDAAQPQEFDRAAFVRAVKEAIARKAPQNLDEADSFAESERPAEIKAQVEGQVDEGKEASATQIATTIAAPPDTSKAVSKKVGPLTRDRPPGVPGRPNPAGAVPDRLPPAATDTSGGPRHVDRQMADAQITEAQLAKSNEPRFKQALDGKKAMEREAPRAQHRMRAHEAGTLAAATAGAAGLGAAAMQDMTGTRTAAGRRVGAGKDTAKSRDEAKRAQVTATLQRVFDATKNDVEDILSGLDHMVDDQFTREERSARDDFTAEHRRLMDDYKDRRYGGAAGKLRWAGDLIGGLPEEANRIFVVARDHYVTRMETVIGNIADTIAAELKRAKKRIADGKAQLHDAVRRLPADLRAIGREAAGEFADRFDELHQEVDDKGTELVDTLATRYTDALKDVDDEIAAEKEKNKGVAAKVVDAVKGVIDTITELKNLLLGVLRKAAQAVLAILKDPIGFLGNLVSGVGGGLKLFMSNAKNHLVSGLLTWLLGVAPAAGLKIPTTFDVRGIFLLLAGLLGVSWAGLRARLAGRVPPQAMTAAETAVPLVAQLKKRGIEGLWDEVRSRVGDLKRELTSKLVEYLVPTIIVAGATTILSMLNPASAFIRACKLIIDIIRFIVTQARQIIAFVDAVLDAVIAVARGGTGGVPALVERALARSIPVLLGALAALLGLGGIPARVRQIFQSMSRPVTRAIDAVLDKITGLIKKLWAKIKPRKPGRSGDRTRPAAPGRPKTPRGPGAPRRPRRDRADQQDARIKRLVQSAEATIASAPPELAREIDSVSEGRVIYRGSGIGRGLRAIRAFLARHRGARFDRATGMLALPPSPSHVPDSLSSLGAAMARATGVSIVRIERVDDGAEVWGEINPATRLARIRGLATADAVLRIAVAQHGILQFLENLATNRPMTVTQGTVTGTIGLPQFITAWATASNRNFVKKRFRDAMKGTHEWLPSDYILDVTQRAATDAVEGTRWLTLQHDLRSNTFEVVFDPDASTPDIVYDRLPRESRPRNFSIPQGHVGAVYYPTVSKKDQQTDGTGAFHNDLRAAFTSARNVKESAQRANAVMRLWVWDGGKKIAPQIHPKARDKNGVSVTPVGQRRKMQKIVKMFRKHT
ncbi:phage tail protein [Catenuloplanes niger]